MLLGCESLFHLLQDKRFSVLTYSENMIVQRRGCRIQLCKGITAVSIYLCICQALAETLRRQLYQAPVSKHLLTYTKVSGFGNCIWDGSLGGAVSGRPFLQASTFNYSLSVLLQFPWGPGINLVPDVPYGLC